MSSFGVQLTFINAETSVAFARELNGFDKEAAQFRLAAFEPKLSMDAETLMLVVKFGGTTASAVVGFLSLARAIMNQIKKPAVKIEIEGKRVELFAKATDEDIKALCDILLRAQK